MEREYIVTKLQGGYYFVWYEEMGAKYPYLVRMGSQCACTCPHWRERITTPGNPCKHVEIVLEQGAWNEEEMPDKQWRQVNPRIFLPNRFQTGELYL